MFGYEIIGNRISSFFKEELILGSFLTRILPILIYLIILFDYDLKKNYLFFLSFFILYFFQFTYQQEDFFYYDANIRIIINNFYKKIKKNIYAFFVIFDSYNYNHFNFRAR